jgi:hypothetical protein
LEIYHIYYVLKMHFKPLKFFLHLNSVYIHLNLNSARKSEHFFPIQFKPLKNNIFQIFFWYSTRPLNELSFWKRGIRSKCWYLALKFAPIGADDRNRNIFLQVNLNPLKVTFFEFFFDILKGNCMNFRFKKKISRYVDF